jgi:hypothetical protein
MTLGNIRLESKRVDEFANMSDEELEAYVNGDRDLEHNALLLLLLRRSWLRPCAAPPGG